MIIDALKNRYSLPLLLQKLQLSKSSYYYQEQSLQKEDKYTLLRVRVIELFTENKGRYGYRRIHALLKRENIIVSEKVIRRIMKEEQLVVKIKRTRKYNSYQGEISPAVDNLIKRNFSASKPNEKWLTDITEFAIPAGKVYLSPIVDCFDGLLVNWNISTFPDALLVNSMLDDAAKLLSVGENQSYIQTEAYTTAGQAGLTGWRKMVSYDQCQRKAFQLQPTLHIIPDKEIIARHLTSYDVEPFVIRTTDDVPFELIVLWQIEVVNFHTDVDAFMGSKVVVMCQERKAVCT